jgi:N-acylneuraminate cytidylyltransferase
MIDGERVIAVIPARGGSKGVPHKNIAHLGDKPLIAWSIEVGRAVESIDRVIVSTDDEVIGQIALKCGAEVYWRPARLASDSAVVIDVLRDLIATLKMEGENARIMALLEPTCPFRSVVDVTACIEAVVRGRKDSVATFKEADLNPHRAWTIAEGVPRLFISGVNPWLPRQELPEAYQLNGAAYCFRTDRLSPTGEGLLFGDSGAVIMPAERSVDINTRSDLRLAETMLAERGASGNE